MEGLLTKDQAGPGVGRGNYIHTYSDKLFYIEDPQPEDIDIHDIAHSLAMQCRFNGHTHNFYSVAEHSVIVSKLVSPENALWGLLHDATEAYLCDIPRPFKPYLENYKILEEKIALAIAEKFNLPWPMPEEVHDIDSKIVAHEAMALWPEPPAWTETYELLNKTINIRCWDPTKAKFEFMYRYNHITIN